jgi:hypothetical protein
MKRSIAAALANFFLPGLGYLINGVRHPLMSLAFLAGVIGLTFVETSLQAISPDLYWTMFASVLVMNAAFAVDAWREAKIHRETAAPPLAVAAAG